jgi:recombination protein RecR
LSTYPSKILEEAVRQFSHLPGIGSRSALRLVLHLLKENEQDVVRFGETIKRLRQEIRYCQQCFTICENTLCTICADTSRDRSLLCIVEDVRDVIAIENTSQYKGLYHVLGGIISPIDGIGPGDLNIEPLLKRLQQGEIKEIIMALSATMEGDTTIFYLYKKMMHPETIGIRITTIARGVAIGDELEYADEVTLGRSIINRTPYENYIQK